MGSERLLIAFFCCLVSINNFAQRHSDKLNSFDALLFSGITTFPSGKFINSNGVYGLYGGSHTVLSFGIGLRMNKPSGIFYQTELEYSYQPTYYNSDYLPPNFSDSIYSPFGIEYSSIDLSMNSVLFSVGLGKTFRLQKRLSYSLWGAPTVNLTYNSVRDMHTEAKEPYQLGSKKDTILIFRMAQNFLAPGLRFRANAQLNAGKFQFSISGFANYFFVSPVKGEFTFFPGLNLESNGIYKSSKLTYGVQLMIGFRAFGAFYRRVAKE